MLIGNAIVSVNYYDYKFNNYSSIIFDLRHFYLYLNKLKSGDTVEIITSTTQQPKQDWLNFVVTGKARSKIRQTLNEKANRDAESGRELLQRRFKNRKLELDEALMSKLIKKLGYKSATDFYNAVGQDKQDVNAVMDGYVELE